MKQIAAKIELILYVNLELFKKFITILSQLKHNPITI